MHNQDIELRLQQAAQRLPEPKGTLPTTDCVPTRSRRSPMAIAIACALILALLIPAGVMAGSGGVSGWSGHTATFADVEELGFHYPARLGDYQLPSVVDEVIIAPQEFDETQAMQDPSYSWLSLEYAKDEYSNLEVRFGSTDNDLWAHCFRYDLATGEWDQSKNGFETEYDGIVESGSIENVTVVEYRGRTIWLYDFVHRTTDPASPLPEFRDGRATWVDAPSGLVFEVLWSGTNRSSFTVDGELVEEYVRPYQVLTQAELLDYVKIIIDGQE